MLPGIVACERKDDANTRSMPLADAYDRLTRAGLVGASFVDNRGSQTERYPENPNGSVVRLMGLLLLLIRMVALP